MKRLIAQCRSQFRHGFKQVGHQAVVGNIEKRVTLRCDYPHLSEVLRLAKQHGVEVLQQDLQLDCRLHCAVPLANYAACIDAWQKTRAVEILEDTQSNEEAT